MTKGKALDPCPGSYIEVDATADPVNGLDQIIHQCEDCGRVMVVRTPRSVCEYSNGATGELVATRFFGHMPRHNRKDSGRG